MTRQTLYILLGPLFFLLLQFLPLPKGMSHASLMVLACTAWIITWWLTEAVPIGVTSLLPLVLFPLSGAANLAAVTGSYSRPIIFLFLGGFILALAMERWDLHRRIALQIIAKIGTQMPQIILGFVVATGFLSMWISNTATTVMMLPIGLSIIGYFRGIADEGALDSALAEKFGRSLLLSIPYAASIGGIATLVGTPTNLIFAESVKEFYGVEIPFDQWFIVGFPIAVLLLGLCWWHLSRSFRDTKEAIKGDAKEQISALLAKLGKMKPEEKRVLLVFSLVAIAWIARRYLINPFWPAINDTNIALIGAFSLFVIPASDSAKGYLMDWQTARKLPWEVLFLFGGAFAIAAGFEESGLTNWIGSQLGGLQGIPAWLLLLTLIAMVNFLTELTMNMATCTLLMPVMVALSPVINMHPYVLMAATCASASCAFMLPVATAPNAVVFGSGMLKVREMVRAGFLLNVMSIFVVFLLSYYLLPYAWGIDIHSTIP